MSVTEKKAEIEKDKAKINEFVEKSNFSHILVLRNKNEIDTDYPQIIEKNREKHANPIKEQIYKKVNGIVRIHTAKNILNSLNELSDLEKADLLKIYNTINYRLIFNMRLKSGTNEITIVKAKKNELDNILIDYKEEFNKKWEHVDLKTNAVRLQLATANTILYTNEEFYVDEQPYYGRTVSVVNIPMKKIGQYTGGAEHYIKYLDENDNETDFLIEYKDKYEIKTLKIYKEKKVNQDDDTSGGKRRKTRRRNRKSKKTRKSRNNRRKSKRKSLR